MADSRCRGWKACWGSREEGRGSVGGRRIRTTGAALDEGEGEGFLGIESDEAGGGGRGLGGKEWVALVETGSGLERSLSGEDVD
jgi:hypothetical protein